MKLEPGDWIHIYSEDGCVIIKTQNSITLASDIRHPEMGINMMINVVNYGEKDVFDL